MAWHFAIREVGAGLATVLGNTQVVIVPIAAWLLLGEKPGARVAASVPLVLIGVVLISGILGEARPTVGTRCLAWPSAS